MIIYIWLEAFFKVFELYPFVIMTFVTPLLLGAYVSMIVYVERKWKLIDEAFPILLIYMVGFAIIALVPQSFLIVLVLFLVFFPMIKIAIYLTRNE